MLYLKARGSIEGEVQSLRINSPGLWGRGPSNRARMSDPGKIPSSEKIRRQLEMTIDSYSGVVVLLSTFPAHTHQGAGVRNIRGLACGKGSVNRWGNFVICSIGTKVMPVLRPHMRLTPATCHTSCFSGQHAECYGRYMYKYRYLQFDEMHTIDW